MGETSRLKPLPAQMAVQMLTPRRLSRGGGLWIEDAERFEYVSDGERISVLRVGEAPFVLLVHGWEGAAVDFASVLPALLAAGFGVLLPDLPAHGMSSGRTMTLPAAARAVHECGRRFGPLYAAVAHSIGGAVLGEAMQLGLAVERAVLLAPPRRYLDGVDAVCRACAYDANERDELLAALRQHGVDAASLDLPRTVSKLDVPALIVHSDDDTVTPDAAGRSVAAAWQGSRFVSVSGLGHRRILRDATVVDEIVRFVAHEMRSDAVGASPPFRSSASSGSMHFAGGLPS